MTVEKYLGTRASRSPAPQAQKAGVAIPCAIVAYEKNFTSHGAAATGPSPPGISCCSRSAAAQRFPRSETTYHAYIVSVEQYLGQLCLRSSVVADMIRTSAIASLRTRKRWIDMTYNSVTSSSTISANGSWSDVCQEGHVAILTDIIIESQ